MAAERGTPPMDMELAAARAKLPAKLREIDDAATTVKPFCDVPVTLDAIGKGYVLNRASAKAQKLDGVKGLVLVIGGELRVRGSDPAGPPVRSSAESGMRSSRCVPLLPSPRCRSSA